MRWIESATCSIEGARRRVALLALLGCTMALPISAVADAAVAVQMSEAYEEFVDREDDSLPFTLDSATDDGVSSAAVSAYLADVDMAVLVDRLSDPAEWCEFIPIHLNIKACAVVTDGDRTTLRFYLGVKTYLTPDRASLLALQFRSSYADGVFTARMTAKDGPYGSSNYNFELRAIEVDGGAYIVFDLSSQPGVAAGLASIYLMTVARKKVGFSIDGTTWSGKPRYVGGERGAVERNIVRYLLAIQTYFETLDVASDDRFEERIERWFTETEKYSRQLRELDRETYLTNKKKEWRNQQILMAAIADNVTPVYEIPREKNP